MQECTANASFVVCHQQQLRTRVFTFLGSNQFVWCIFCELRHSGVSPVSIANLGCGRFCWALLLSLFALFPCWMAKRISGWGICVFALCGLFWWCFCAVDLPSYMTTGVHVDVILHCFFSCKNRASERDRPCRRKKRYRVNYIG